jgi:hypothetical protein
VLGRGDYHYRHEPILYGWLDNAPHYFSGDRSQDSVFDVDRPMVSDLHPTTKPIELIARMLANSSNLVNRSLTHSPAQVRPSWQHTNWGVSVTAASLTQGIWPFNSSDFPCWG